MTQLSNSEVALALGLSHSSVSRMRSGDRVASVETLSRIVDEYHADPRVLLAAATKAVGGHTEEWVAYLRQILDDGELDSSDSKSA